MNKAKEIIKEIIIMLLLCLAIILILGVLLYEYVPSKKIIPEDVSYTTPANIKEELAQTEIEDTTMDITFNVQASDLKNYQKINDYVPGRKNPFAEIGTSEGTNGQNTSTNNGSQTAGESNSTNTNSNTNTGYFQDKGTK